MPTPHRARLSGSGPTACGTGALSAATAVVPAVAAVVLAGTPASAHTGLPAHDALGGLLHPLTGWDHLLAMVAVGVVAVSARDRRIAVATPLAFVGAMVAGGALGMAGVNLGATELEVSLSVVALGALVASPLRGGWWLPLGAALFGLAHGHAHGAELQPGAVAASYVAGLVLATAALHAAGTVLGLGLRRLPRLQQALGASMAAAGVLFALR